MWEIIRYFSLFSLFSLCFVTWRSFFSKYYHVFNGYAGLLVFCTPYICKNELCLPGCHGRWVCHSALRPLSSVWAPPPTKKKNKKKKTPIRIKRKEASREGAKGTTKKKGLPRKRVYCPQGHSACSPSVGFLSSFSCGACRRSNRIQVTPCSCMRACQLDQYHPAHIAHFTLVPWKPNPTLPLSLDPSPPPFTEKREPAMPGKTFRSSGDFSFLLFFHIVSMHPMDN